MEKTMAKLNLSIQQQPDELSFSRLNLFFIKSKHAFRQFKNHDYFENRRSGSNSRKGTKQNEFVQFPAPYGINNAYNYICNEASKSVVPKHQPQRRRNKTDVDLRHSSMKAKCNVFSSDPKRNTHFCLPGLTLSDLRKQETTCHQTIIDGVPPRIQRPHPKSDEVVQLIFVDQGIEPQKWKNYELRVNIYSHIMSTFLRSRINYQEMTQEQFVTLKNLIVQIYGRQKEYIEYKDIVNIRSLRQVFAVLQGDKYQPVYKQEMVRYFFVTNQLAYEYQLNRLKDQLKTLAGYQFGKDIGNHQLYLFHASSGTEIPNLHTLLKYQGKFIFATDPKAITLYRGFVRDKEAQEKLVNQIQRWRSVAPEQNQQIDSFKFKPADHYHRLFDNVQKKRDRFPRSKKKPIGSLKSSQFIDRSKLCKEDEIFQ